MTTDYSCLRFATEEHVAQILLDAPPVNCIGEGLLQDLEWLLDTLEHMPQLRAVVIGSTNPKIFCAGADVNQFLSWDAESGAKMSGWGNRIFDRHRRAAGAGDLRDQRRRVRRRFGAGDGL